MTIRRLKPGQFVELECKHFVAEGLGLSYFSDESQKEKFKPHVFFVWGVLPGEKFIARIAKVKSKNAHGVLAHRENLPPEIGGEFAHDTWALRNLSPERVKPECDIYLRCGGCRLQHMSYSRTVAYKEEWLRTQLQRNKVQIETVDLMDLPENTRRHYRNHVQVHINKFGTYGFYEPISYRTHAFPEHGCLIFDEKPLRANFPKFPIEVKAARIRINVDGKAVYTVLNSREEQQVTARYSVAWPEGRHVDIEFPVTGFFQANLRALPFWLDTIREFFSRSGFDKPRVLELFSGFGFISRMVSLVQPMDVFAMDILSKEQVQQVRFFENSEEIVSEFSAQFKKVDLFLPEKLPEPLLKETAKFKPQVLLINPPRAGLLPAIWQRFRDEALRDFQGPIIYSSCDAATMARDLAMFSAEGYQVETMRVFDFFPWTHHYETVSYLTRSL